MRDYEINSDLKQSKFENLKFVQGDTGSKIIVNLFEDSQTVNLSNCTVLAKYKRSDGYTDNKEANIEDNTITVEVDETMTATAGVLKLIFEITYETTKKVSTFMLLADVAEGIGAKSTTGGGTGDVVVDVDLSNYYNKQEIDKKLDNIANQFTHEQTSNSYKIKYGDTVIANIPLGGNVQVTSYAITNNLNYCNNDNSATEIIEGNPYVANISANVGYELSSVSVSMGGVDITSSCYSNGVISIASVTGDIIISAIANVIVIPSTEPVLTYNFNNNIAGNGHGIITMSVGATEDEGSYDIKYADDTGELTNYDKICTLNPTVDNPSSYSYFNKEQLIPKYATRLLAIKDNNVKAEFEIPTSKRFSAGNYGQHLYSFGAISDVHLSVDTAESDFATALTYLNNNENIAFTCISGDITDGGTEEQFSKYKSIVEANSSSTDVYATVGNHELKADSNLADRWSTYVSNTQDYVFTHNNDVFILFGLTTVYGVNIYSAEKRTWLEEQLEKYKNARVFLFTHPFINGTDNGNYNNLYTLNILNKDENCGLWLINLLKQYTNVFCFSGHSHFKFITQELNSKMTICNNVDDTEIGYLVHIPSITIPRDVESGAISDYLYAQSEGVVIDVYENCILYRGRNFVDEKFIPIGQFILQKSEGTLPIATTYNISNTLTNCTNSNASTTIEEGSSYQATISANSGYTLGTITVTMGSTDITSSCVSSNSINIASVTGDITITANATKILSNYTITNNLDNCSNSNTSTSITEGQSYQATITPNSGYELSSVVVTMGGEDITSTVYSNGEINISSITGNIIITVTATVSVQEWTGGKNRFDEVWTADYKLNTADGTIASASGNGVSTNYIYVGDCDTFTISTSSAGHYTVCGYNSEKNFVSRYGTGYTKTTNTYTNEGHTWIKFSMTSWKSDIVTQIEKGSSATEHEAYTEPTTPIQ